MWLLIVFGMLLPAYAVKSGELDELIDLRYSLQRMESALNSQLARTVLLEDRILALESEVLHWKRIEIERASATNTDPVSCGCNLLLAPFVNISAPTGPQSPVELSVGTPETGTVNGVNINKLANSAVRTAGDQSISGTLSVDSLQVGAWKFVQSSDGDLIISSSFPGGVSVPSLLASALSTDSLFVSAEIGVILMWHGALASIPASWALCDGQVVAGVTTPDLRDRFVVGAGGGYVPADVGGASNVTLSIMQIPAHQHIVSLNGIPKEPIPPLSLLPSVLYEANQCFDPDVCNFEPINTSVIGGGQPHENLPPFYALAYIMRVK